MGGSAFGDVHTSAAMALGGFDPDMHGISSLKDLLHGMIGHMEPFNTWTKIQNFVPFGLILNAVYNVLSQVSFSYWIALTYSTITKHDERPSLLK